MFRERVRSWLGPVKDAGPPGGWDWKEDCSSEHVRRDVPAIGSSESERDIDDLGWAQLWETAPQ